MPLVQANFWRAPLPFAEAVFDAALALHGTLAHPPHEGAVEGLANELARVVVSGGRLVAEVPSPAWLDRIPSLPRSRDQRIERTGPRTCVYEDLVVGASIEARVLDAAEWKVMLGPAWETAVEPFDELEWLVTARRL